MSKVYSILIVEDEPVIGMEIESFLRAHGFGVSGIAKNADAARRLFVPPFPDAVILDVNLGEDDGIDLAHELMFSTHVPLIYLTAHGDTTTVQRARDTRPSSYLVKPFNERELFAAIDLGIYNHLQRTDSRKPVAALNTVLPTPLTERELAVVNELLQGKSNREIAESLFVTVHTIKSQMQTVFDKFDVRNRTELMFRITEVLR